ncbi:sulfatase family protein [Sunxiuqinia sp. A32]|uniref:sulfatase family protein n=1 Tax=Sunxiuqinia sp. A32 TaxID=3461496 RepID=UPI0040467235
MKNLLLLVFVIQSIFSFGKSTENSKPNIIVILADDMGVGDIKALYPGCKIKTPNLDKLANEGLVFSDAHSASAVCTPTRYSLLTGRYAWRTKLQYHVLLDYDKPLIAPDMLTMPEILKECGYQTAAIGKWHLGFDWKQNADDSWDYKAKLGGGPVSHGFDYYFGTDVPNLPPYTYIENDYIAIQPTSFLQDTIAPWVPDGPRIGYDIDEEILPFLPPGEMAPDWKFDEILPDLTKKACQYIQQQAENEKPFFIYFSMTSPHVPIAPSGDFLGKSGIHQMADFIMETDWSVGQILDELENAGIAKNTLVVFAADNGHDDHAYGNELEKAGHIGSGPYRESKGSIYEGGHRVPFIVRYPAMVKKGVSDQLVCLNDIYPTVAEMIGFKIPETGAPDAVSILPALKGNHSKVLRKNIVHHDVRGRFAIRAGDWKLIVFPPEDGSLLRKELYNMRNDVEEKTDLCAQYPDIVCRLERLLKKQINDGRSTLGPVLKNDRTVDYRILYKEKYASQK